MYRPEGWKNPHIRDMPTIDSRIRYDVFEAGADAMLEGLIAKGHRVLPQDNDVLSNLYPNRMGWSVFIPEEKDTTE